MTRITPSVVVRGAALLSLLALPALPITARAAGAQSTDTAAGAASGSPVASAMANVERQRAAIAKLAPMVGEWRGEGWMDQGQGRQSFRGVERVERKLDGLALLVEGLYTARMPGAAEEVPIHTTLGVISYDARGDRYTFDTWLASGAAGEHRLELVEGGWRWFLETPAGQVRYTATFPAGEWVEIGEIERGGQWHQFFEMRLKREAK